MEAKKCDRCGGFYEEEVADIATNAIKAIKSTIENLYERKAMNIFCKLTSDIDLCEKCEESLKEWCIKWMN